MVLNGPPRSGKSSIADVIQETFDGPWLSLGADVYSQFVTPPRLRPGIGPRPGGGERPDIEELIPALYAAPPRRVRQAAARPPGRGEEAKRAARAIGGRPLPAARDHAAPQHRPARPRGPLPHQRARRGDPRAGGLWQLEVHQPGIYDLEIDTSAVTAAAAAAMIRERLDGPSPTAFRELAERA